MNYKVLYRKYRPNNFDEVVGQNNTIKLLKDSIIGDKVAHAYVFSGPRGTGKTSTAKIFAKTLNCTDIIDGNPCGKCEQCLNFNNSNDIYEIDAASNNGVEQIREIIDNIKLLPIHSKYKIYIIDEVHMLSPNAFNALLLTLEEPPSHVVFILATTNIEAIPITILSRCQRLNFKKISNIDLIDNMKLISKKENITITNDALNEIAMYSDGGMRDALSVLDQLSKLNKDITLELVQNELGFISNEFYEKLIVSVEENNIDNIIQIIDNLKNQAIDYKMSIKKLICVLKARCVYSLNNISTLNFDEYKKMCFELANSLNNLNVNINSYDMLELILLEHANKPVKPVVPREIKEVVTSSNKTQINNEIDLIQKESNVNKSFVNIRINNCFVNCNKGFKNEISALWKQFMNDISNKKIKSLILDTEVLAASDKVVLIKSDLLDHVELINEQSDIISQEFHKFSSKNVLFCCLDDNLWKKESQLFMEKLKNGEKYHYIDENHNDDENINISDVFDTSVVEVK